jgi:hypothetical protein
MLGRPVAPAVLGSDVDSLYGSDRSRSFGMLDAGSSRVAFSHAFLSSLFISSGVTGAMLVAVPILEAQGYFQHPAKPLADRALFSLRSLTLSRATRTPGMPGLL